jgi:hypothetical protein
LEDLNRVLVGDVLENGFDNVMELCVEAIASEGEISVEEEIAYAVKFARVAQWAAELFVE